VDISGSKDKGKLVERRGRKATGRDGPERGSDSGAASGRGTATGIAPGHTVRADALAVWVTVTFSGAMMTVLNQNGAGAPNLADRLDQQEAEWQKRKVRRLARALHLETRALGEEIRGYYDCEVDRSDLQVTVRIAGVREIRLALRAGFDADGALRQSYHVLDRQIRRGLDYEERDMDYSFSGLREAVARFEELSRSALRNR
jgi:hypothetical protein